jgi:hypothetical protein
MANWKFGKVKGKLEERLERKIERDNREICRFFEDSFGKPVGEIAEREIEETYMYLNPKITKDDGEVLQGWEEIKPWLKDIESGTNCEPSDEVPVDLDLDYLPAENTDGQVKDDFDLEVHVKTTFIFGGKEKSAGIDPGGEGRLRHRRTCDWGH